MMPSMISTISTIRNSVCARVPRARAWTRAAGGSSAEGDRRSKADAVYLRGHDRKTAVRDSRLGRVRHADHSEEHKNHSLRGRENLQSGELETRAPLHPQRAHLVFQADEPYGDRRGR